MEIIIVGCGKVGYTVVEQLSAEKHNITVIDLKEERIEHVTNEFDAMGIVGNGVSYPILVQAGVETADLLIAVTGSDEQNLLCGVFAKQAGHCRVIARVRNPIYNSQADFLRDELGLAMIINPDLVAAREISRVFQFPSAIKIDSFAKGRMELFHFRINPNSLLIGQPISYIRSLRCEILINMVIRGDELIIPDGSYIFQAGDIVSLVSDQKNVKDFFKRIKSSTQPVKKAMLVGGGKLAYYLADSLISNGIETTIIESDRQRCEHLSEILPRATIIHGDGTDQHLLKQENLENMDGFAALTGMDEENILLSLYALGVGNKKKAITKINRIKFTEVINSLALDSIIYPCLITADLITKYVRSMSNSQGSNFETFYRLADGKAEALEFTIDEESPATGIPLMDLRIKKNILICSIFRNGRHIIPGGQDILQKGDSVVITALADYHISDLVDILEV